MLSINQGVAAGGTVPRVRGGVLSHIRRSAFRFLGGPPAGMVPFHCRLPDAAGRARVCRVAWSAAVLMVPPPVFLGACFHCGLAVG